MCVCVCVISDAQFWSSWEGNQDKAYHFCMLPLALQHPSQTWSEHGAERSHTGWNQPIPKGSNCLALTVSVSHSFESSIRPLGKQDSNPDTSLKPCPKLPPATTSRPLNPRGALRGRPFQAEGKPKEDPHFFGYWNFDACPSRTSCAVSFLHKSGCAFVYQPLGRGPLAVGRGWSVVSP